jgi:hypothetical protein
MRETLKKLNYILWVSSAKQPPFYYYVHNNKIAPTVPAGDVFFLGAQAPDIEPKNIKS